MTGKKRVLFFDTARVVSMIWIVCIWHLSASMRSFPNLTNPICSSITVAALSVFTFISAFFVSGRVKTKSDIIPFYINRFSRFFFLYAISCASMVTARYLSGSESMMTIQQFVLSLLGLSTLIGPSPITLWFFSMLILFYLITPFIDLIQHIAWKIVSLVLIYCMITGFILLFDGDLRVLVFYPSYCVGLLLSQDTKSSISSGRIFENKRFPVYALIDVIVLVVSVALYAENYDSVYWMLYRIPISLASIGFVIIIAKMISFRCTQRVIMLGSYISMCVYLFHSQFFWIAELIFGKMTYAQAYLIILPLLFVTCWMIQRLYDTFSRWLRLRRMRKDESSFSS